MRREPYFVRVTITLITWMTMECIASHGTRGRQQGELEQIAIIFIIMAGFAKLRAQEYRSG